MTNETEVQTTVDKGVVIKAKRAPRVKAEKKATVAPKTTIAHLAMDGRKIDANVKAIGTRGKALDALTHSTAVAIVIQSLPHAEGGHLDASKAVAIVRSMSEGMSRKRLVAWFTHFSNIRVTFSEAGSKAGQWSARLIKPGQADYKTVDVSAANKTPYYALNKEADVTPKVIDDLRFAQMLSGFVKRLNEAKEKGLLNLTPVNMAEMARLAKESEVVSTRAKRMVEQAGKAALKSA